MRHRAHRSVALMVFGWAAIGLVATAACGAAPETVESEAPPPEAVYEPPVVPPVPRDLTAADIERMMTDLSNWGRWGPDDQLGAANLITPEKRLAAAALVTEGTTVSLAHTLLTTEDVDVAQPFEHTMGGVPDPSREPGLMGGVSDTYRITYHGYSHSHLDALCHISYRGQNYNGFSEQEITEAGCGKLGIHHLKNGIVTRGVLIDIPRLKGVPYLEPGTAIYPEDLDAWEAMAGIHVMPGDAIFLRTGRWARRAAEGPWDVSEGTAGFHASVVPWLKARDVAFIGSDAALDVTPSQVEGVALPVHMLTIVALGINLFDNVDLEALADTAASLNRWEFMLTAGVLPVEGGTGSPVNALAVF